MDLREQNTQEEKKKFSTGADSCVPPKSLCVCCVKCCDMPKAGLPFTWKLAKKPWAKPPRILTREKISELAQVIFELSFF